MSYRCPKNTNLTTLCKFCIIMFPVNFSIIIEYLSKEYRICIDSRCQSMTDVENCSLSSEGTRCAPTKIGPFSRAPSPACPTRTAHRPTATLYCKIKKKKKHYMSFILLPTGLIILPSDSISWLWLKITVIVFSLVHLFSCELYTFCLHSTISSYATVQHLTKSHFISISRVPYRVGWLYSAAPTSKSFKHTVRTY